MKQALDDMTKRGKLKPGDRLPSEIVLSRQIGISRTALREAYRLLERDGMITVRMGSGTYLSAPLPVIRNTLNDLSSTGALIRQAGFAADAEVLELRHKLPDPEWKEKLGLGDGERVVMAKRLRRAGDASIALSWNIMPESLVGYSFDEGIHESIFRHLEKECQIVTARAHTGVFALDRRRSCDREAKRLLGDMTILMRRLHYDLSGIAVLYSLDYVRTDLMEMTIQQERRDFSHL